jgi:hypothetical protein
MGKVEYEENRMKREVGLTARAAKVGIVLGLACLLAAPVAAAASQGPGTAKATKLVGVFKITGGKCSSTGGVTSGSYFRMIEPGGIYVGNNSSKCKDDTYTPLLPGTAGGLSTKAYQRNPNPEFDTAGNALADLITKPQGFEGINFAVSTNPTDPQTGDKVPVPSITVSGGKISGQTEAFSVGWSKQNFNQGSPKPGGSHPGSTSGPTGTYNASKKTFVLKWESEIIGGPFNGFTGEWYLVGTFSG